ncbi:abortive infection system antitoxin AbiGi family protein [Aneurinibacillus sp. Ricciae_BoGa-3]|uniref:abortive infection system antitoxin AbiGi family protein n=1 Tax=Aneurinibacillus sp. Ricciae_BoGa-3 TaxID=3022697 RepID=UPI0023426754|nr:abortive infection system antitoxin AbiGi family protein [Aneurinibacillus sp. Ricciae_BoGa-3]WCK52683.1 abortive infection system antitoxin AbiGi family protein [Aneurinibacillus sp. Ricciae_BoGa-3]
MQQRYYSKIYWHFTGSPNVNWHLVKNPEDINKYGPPKADRASYEILLRILDTKKLLAKSTEKIGEGIITDKFCSTTDIPFKDLVTHAPYYGKVAIGYKAHAIQKCFMPVLYLPLHHPPFVKSVLNEATVNSSELTRYLLNFLKITNFEPEEKESLYREREWRHIGDFNFDMHDVAAIVVPECYIPSIVEFLVSRQCVHNISVIAWEFIEQA